MPNVNRQAAKTNSEFLLIAPWPSPFFSDIFPSRYRPHFPSCGHTIRRAIGVSGDEVRVFWSRLRNKPAQPDQGPEPEKWRGEPRCGFVSAAVRLGKQWYLAPSLGSFCSGGALQGSVKLTRIAAEPVGPAKLVTLRLDSTQNYGSSAAGTQSLTLLGIGPSRKPSRLGPILLSTLVVSEPAPASTDSLKTRDYTN